jgi:hypothetical protein
MLFAPALLSVVLVSAIIGAGVGSVIWRHPHGALWVSIGAAALTVAVLGVHVAVPVIHQSPHTGYPWPAIATDYFMAMGHRIYGGPYAFTWTPPWVYPVSAITPLIAPGAAVTTVAAFWARREHHAAGSLLMAGGALTFIAFIAFASYVAIATRNGVPV